MAATAEQMQASLQEIQRMNARLQTAEQSAADAGAASAAAHRAAAADRQQLVAGGRPSRLVDTRPLGRPRECKNVREDWSNWCFQFKAFVSGAHPDAGVAMTKLQNVEAYSGLEAWRQLVLEFEPHTAGRRRLHLTNLPRPTKSKNMEKLDEEIKIGVLAYLAPDMVIEHLFLFADKLRTTGVRRGAQFAAQSCV
eukprot:6328501-Amphidinium_carterae.1